MSGCASVKLLRKLTPESPPRPKPYSWTAAFALRASFTVGKAGVGAEHGLNHANSRIREHGRGGCLSRG